MYSLSDLSTYTCAVGSVLAVAFCLVTWIPPGKSTGDESGLTRFDLAVSCVPNATSSYCAVVTATFSDPVPSCGSVPQCVASSGYFSIETRGKENISSKESLVARIRTGWVPKDVRIVETDRDLHVFWSQQRDTSGTAYRKRRLRSNHPVEILRSWRDKSGDEHAWSQPDTVLTGNHLLASDMDIATVGEELHVIVQDRQEEDTSNRYLWINGRENAKERAYDIPGGGYYRIEATQDSIFVAYMGVIPFDEISKGEARRTTDNSNNVLVVSRPREGSEWSNPRLVVDTGDNMAHRLSLSRHNRELYVTFIEEEEGATTRFVRRATVGDSSVHVETLFELKTRPSTSTHLSTFTNRLEVVAMELGVNANRFYGYHDATGLTQRTATHTSKGPHITWSPTGYIVNDRPCVAYTLVAVGDTTFTTQKTCF